jgi:alpha-1,3-rhamnosyl/mannosyltransferase
MTPRRIGLNLLWLVPGVVGGSEEYTVRLLRALAAAAPPDLRFELLANRLVLDAYPELASAFPVSIGPVSGRSKMLRVGAESTWLAIVGRRDRLDLIHHLGGIIPFVRTVPAVVTIHDLQPLVMPEHFAPLKRAFSQIAVPYAARHARAVVTLTRVTEKMLVDLLSVPARRISVIHPGMNAPTADELAEERRVDVRGHYALGDRPFFLYPAITYPHKNHAFLLDAFAPVVAARPEALLVLTGGAAQSEDDTQAHARELGISSNVRRLGRIPRGHLDALYQQATALVFPSRFEGFGIPVVEAMARGCPVVAADETALPEVVDDGGVLLALDQIAPWRDEMIRLLDDDAHRAELAEAGRRRVSEFDWSKAADELLEVYRRVLEGDDVRGPAA